jgi:bifunctional DNA-binding transcriptional regulator/antitoxin component of YhaV-PrlF toxin-antitoxin module
MYFHGKDEEMPLIRMTRISGRRIIITLPSQILDAYDIKNSDFLEITPLQQGEILMKKTEEKELVR